MNEYIILQFGGRWCMYHETFTDVATATKEASKLDCTTLVLSVNQVAAVFSAFLSNQETK